MDFFVQCPSLNDSGGRGGGREREERNSLIIGERESERERERGRERYVRKSLLCVKLLIAAVSCDPRFSSRTAGAPF